MARPSIYTQKLAKVICDRIAQGESVRHICEDDKMPSAKTVFLWLLDDDKDWFLQHYVRAKKVQSDQLFEELQEIADESDDVIVGDDKSDNARVQAKKLRVDTLKWRLAKQDPKKYGEKVDVTSGGKPIPLINAIPLNDSDKKNTGTE